MTEQEALGRVFKKLRNKMSQELVGFELGFTQRKVSDLERHGIQQVEDLKTIAEYYDLRVSDLVLMAEEIMGENES